MDKKRFDGCVVMNGSGHIECASPHKTSTRTQLRYKLFPFQWQYLKMYTTKWYLNFVSK